MLPFVLSTNLVRVVKNKSPNFKQIVSRCFELLNILIWIDRSILSQNFKQSHKILYSNSLCVVDIIANSYN